MGATTTLITADQLFEMGEEGRNFELVRGELEEMSPVNEDHGRVVTELIQLIGGSSKPTGLARSARK